MAGGPNPVGRMAPMSPIVIAFRAAGCVFAEEEAQLLATNPDQPRPTPTNPDQPTTMWYSMFAIACAQGCLGGVGRDSAPAVELSGV
jgi:hypothetical protein